MNAPILITGCRRSGTTLLREILTGHPDLYVHPQEPQFLLGLQHRFGDRPRDVVRAVGYLCQHPYCPPEVELSKFLEQVKSDGITQTAGMITAYLELWGGDNLEHRRPVLKDPAFVFHLDRLERWFSDMRVIHLHRDPRGNVASQRRRWPEASLTECAVWWREAVSAARSWNLRHPSRCFHLPYERLVGNPQAALFDLCKFLEIQFFPELLEIDMEEVQYLPDGSTSTQRFIRIDPSRLDLWKGSLSSTEVYLIERIVRAEMEAFGYEPVGPGGIDPRERLRGSIERVQYDVKRQGRRIKHGLRRLKRRAGLGV